MSYERFARQYRFETSITSFLETSTCTSIAHHLSGLSGYAPTRIAHRWHNRSAHALRSAEEPQVSVLSSPSRLLFSFRYAYGFAHPCFRMARSDSLVRVSRRVGTSNFARIANNSEGLTRRSAEQPHGIALLSRTTANRGHRAPQPRRVSVVTTLKVPQSRTQYSTAGLIREPTARKALRYHLSQTARIYAPEQVLTHPATQIDSHPPSDTKREMTNA